MYWYLFFIFIITSNLIKEICLDSNFKPIFNKININNCKYNTIKLIGSEGTDKKDKKEKNNNCQHNKFCYSCCYKNKCLVKKLCDKIKLKKEKLTKFYFFYLIIITILLLIILFIIMLNYYSKIKKLTIILNDNNKEWIKKQNEILKEQDIENNCSNNSELENERRKDSLTLNDILLKLNLSSVKY